MRHAGLDSSLKSSAHGFDHVVLTEKQARLGIGIEMLSGAYALAHSECRVSVGLMSCPDISSFAPLAATDKEGKSPCDVPRSLEVGCAPGDTGFSERFQGQHCILQLGMGVLLI